MFFWWFCGRFGEWKMVDLMSVLTMAGFSKKSFIILNLETSILRHASSSPVRLANRSFVPANDKLQNPRLTKFSNGEAFNEAKTILSS
jgi:hypothetical protein